MKISKNARSWLAQAAAFFLFGTVYAAVTGNLKPAWPILALGVLFAWKGVSLERRARRSRAGSPSAGPRPDAEQEADPAGRP